MKYAVPVMEVMSKKPVTIDPESTVDRAAALMKERDVSSLVVVKDSKPVGIITEKDLVTKVVALDRSPSSLKVSNVMSSPVVTIHSHTEVLEAAKKMASLKIRRLAVVDGGNLVGLVTENDILRIWPSLIEVTRERARIVASQSVDAAPGYCEACSMFSESLEMVEGLLVCRECREES